MTGGPGLRFSQAGASASRGPARRLLDPHGNPQRLRGYFPDGANCMNEAHCSGAAGLPS